MNNFYDEKKYLYTRFTMTLHDILREDPNFLDILVLSTDERTTKLKNMFIAKRDIYEVSGETEKVAKLYITNKFNMYKDYYEELITAYETKIEMLDGKLTSIEIEDTLSSTENKNDTITNENTIVTKDTTESNSTDITKDSGTVKDEREITENITETTDTYDLPRKNTSENTPSTKVEHNTTTTTTDDNTETTDKTKTTTKENTDTRDINTTNNGNETRKGDTTKEETKNKTITTKGQENVIKLKKEYMELLRNIYLEFVNKFEPCFLSLFY